MLTDCKKSLERLLNMYKLKRFALAMVAVYLVFGALTARTASAHEPTLLTIELKGTAESPDHRTRIFSD